MIVEAALHTGERTPDILDTALVIVLGDAVFGDHDGDASLLSGVADGVLQRFGIELPPGLCQFGVLGQWNIFLGDNRACVCTPKKSSLRAASKNGP